MITTCTVTTENTSFGAFDTLHSADGNMAYCPLSQPIAEVFAPITSTVTAPRPLAERNILQISECLNALGTVALGGCMLLALWILGVALQSALSTVAGILIPIGVGLVLLLILSKVVPESKHLITSFLNSLTTTLKKMAQTFSDFQKKQELEKDDPMPSVHLTPEQATNPNNNG
jgi:hypothetical protein